MKRFSSYVSEAAHLTPRRREVLGAIGRAAQDTIERGIPDNKREAALHRRQRVRNAVDAAITAQGYGKSAGEQAKRKRVVGHKLALSRIDRKMEKHYGQQAVAAGENKRGYETRWRKKHMVESATNAAQRKSRLEGSMSVFMDKVRAGRTRPVIHGWILVEPEQVTGQIRGKPTNGRQRFHAWVEDANDSQYVYHYRGEYWWSPSRGDWGMRFTARVHKTDARTEWDELERAAVGTGEWNDGVLTVLSVK